MASPTPRTSNLLCNHDPPISTAITYPKWQLAALIRRRKMRAGLQYAGGSVPFGTLMNRGLAWQCLRIQIRSKSTHSMESVRSQGRRRTFISHEGIHGQGRWHHICLHTGRPRKMLEGAPREPLRSEAETVWQLGTFTSTPFLSCQPNTMGLRHCSGAYDSASGFSHRPCMLFSAMASL